MKRWIVVGILGLVLLGGCGGKSVQQSKRDGQAAASKLTLGWGQFRHVAGEDVLFEQFQATVGKMDKTAVQSGAAVAYSWLKRMEAARRVGHGTARAFAADVKKKYGITVAPQ
jgi:hypothetical protein